MPKDRKGTDCKTMNLYIPVELHKKLMLENIKKNYDREQKISFHDEILNLASEGLENRKKSS